MWNDYHISKGSTLGGAPPSSLPLMMDNEDKKLHKDLEMFGFGRRVCPGHYITLVSLLGYGYVFDTKSCTCMHSSVFLNKVLLKWTFTITQDPMHPIDPWSSTESANTYPMLLLAPPCNLNIIWPTNSASPHHVPRCPQAPLAHRHRWTRCCALELRVSPFSYSPVITSFLNIM